MLAAGMAVAARGQSVDVLHWWTSAGERRAVDRLVQQLESQGLGWNDAAIPGGGGVAAVKVLKSRVLAGDSPDVAQIIGRTLNEWADLGLVVPLDDVAQRGKWKQSMFPVVLQTASRNGRVVAAPLGVHRINTLLFNRSVWERLKLAPPKRWDDIEQAAKAMRSHQILPLAWSDEPWQVATVFEALLLSEGGPALYAELAVAQRAQAWADARVLLALDRLRWLRGLNGEPPTEQRWTASARQLYDGRAGMFFMGDWARGELMAWGAQPGIDFGCVPVPGTSGMHLYSIDTLAMLVGKTQRKPLQERLAELVAQPGVQLAYNQAKGSVPVRMDIDANQLDECARDSWQTLARPGSPLVPSIAHRMAAGESTKDAIADVLHRFVRTRSMTAKEAQARLVGIVKAAGK